MTEKRPEEPSATAENQNVCRLLLCFFFKRAGANVTAEKPKEAYATRNSTEANATAENLKETKIDVSS